MMMNMNNEECMETWRIVCVDAEGCNGFTMKFIAIRGYQHDFKCEYTNDVATEII